MALQQVTYKVIADTVRNFLVTNCQNVGNNYTNIRDPWFKPMKEPDLTNAYHEYDRYVWSDANSEHGVSYIDPYYAIWNQNQIQRYSAQQVQNEVTTFISNLGINENSTIESANDLYNFLGNILSFVSYRIGFITSAMSQYTIYMIYYPSGNPSLSTLNKDNKIFADQIQRMFNIIMDVTYQTGRVTSMTNTIRFTDISKPAHGSWDIATSIGYFN